jgi:hypothetical protein
VNHYLEGPPPEDPFKENEKLYEDYRKDKGDLKNRRYVISKSIRCNWDSILEKWWRKIFKKRRN